MRTDASWQIHIGELAMVRCLGLGPLGSRARSAPLRRSSVLLQQLRYIRLDFAFWK